MNVKWKKGYRFRASAAKAYGFFETMRTQTEDGSIDWVAAEKEAQKKTCPVHNDLEWDDAKCGVMYRVDQLKNMVRKLEYIPAKMDVPVRVYESIKVERTETSDKPVQATRVFKKTEEILADPAGRADLLGQAVRDAISFRRRYAALSELAGLIDAIDETVKQLA